MLSEEAASELEALQRKWLRTGPIPRGASRLGSQDARREAKIRGDELVRQWLEDMTYEELPEAVKAKAKLRFLDTLGSAIPGALASVSRLVGECVTTASKGDEASVWLRDKGSTAAGVALTNRYTSNGLDVHDGDYGAKGRAAAVIPPAVLAVGQKTKASGREILTTFSWAVRLVIG